MGTFSTINLGSVFYRDAGDEYVTRKTNISANIQQTIDFISHQPSAISKPEAAATNPKLSILPLLWP